MSILSSRLTGEYLLNVVGGSGRPRADHAGDGAGFRDRLDAARRETAADASRESGPDRTDEARERDRDRTEAADEAERDRDRDRDRDAGDRDADRRTDAAAVDSPCAPRSSHPRPPKVTFS